MKYTRISKNAQIQESLRMFLTFEFESIEIILILE